NCIRRTGRTPIDSSLARETQLYAAPVSTMTSSSSTRDGLAGFHTRNFAENVPIACLRNNFLNLPKLQFHRSRAPEDRDHYLQGFAVLVHLVHHAGKAGEGAFGDAHRLVLFELDLELGPFLAVGHAVNDLLH